MSLFFCFVFFFFLLASFVTERENKVKLSLVFFSRVRADMMKGEREAMPGVYLTDFRPQSNVSAAATEKKILALSHECDEEELRLLLQQEPEVLREQLAAQENAIAHLLSSNATLEVRVSSLSDLCWSCINMQVSANMWAKRAGCVGCASLVAWQECLKEEPTEIEYTNAIAENAVVVARKTRIINAITNHLMHLDSVASCKKGDIAKPKPTKASGATTAGSSTEDGTYNNDGGLHLWFNSSFVFTVV